MLDLKIKICGLNSSAAVEAAVEASVDYVGCVFDINVIQSVTPLISRDIFINVPSSIKKVAVVSNPNYKELNDIMLYFKPDFMQFNGHETAEYLRLFSEQFNCKIIKTITLQSKKDLDKIANYMQIIDMFLFQPDNDLLHHTQNNKKFFDWQLLKKLKINKPWMISGNISKHNFSFVLRASEAQIINVDTVLNSAFGTKDPVLIKEFVKSFREFAYDEIST